MSITAPLRWVHGVFGEDGMEHIGAVDLGGEVAVVTRVVAPDQMAEGGFAVAYEEEGREVSGRLIMRGGFEWREKIVKGERLFNKGVGREENER